MGMAAAKRLRFDSETLWVELQDGRTFGVPLAWFPRLLRATSEQRLRFEISGGGSGLHWEELDEDVSVEGLLAGRGALMHDYEDLRDLREAKEEAKGGERFSLDEVATKLGL